MNNRYKSEIHHRRSMRLRGYDYSKAGAYFVKLCEVTRECLFGEISNGAILPNKYGETVIACWDELPQHFPGVELDAFILMPNHAHGILVLSGAQTDDLTTRAQRAAPLQKSAPTLGTIIQTFKSAASRRINLLRETPGEPVWLRNYFEHIIRNETELNKIREYITYNPTQWANNKINPANNP